MLVDTDVVIWYMRGDKAARELLDGRPGFSISAVTYMELVQGMRNKRELQALKDALKLWHAQVLLLDERMTTQAMILVERHFHRSGLRMADALIGATAIHHGLKLCTANVKHYRMLSDLEVDPFSPDAKA
jgi:predicted nucleic acid-binding protein